MYREEYLSLLHLLVQSPFVLGHNETLGVYTLHLKRFRYFSESGILDGELLSTKVKENNNRQRRVPSRHHRLPG